MYLIKTNKQSKKLFIISDEGIMLSVAFVCLFVC